jgi:nucleoside-diphosphate-sugar epimerase/pimeloyl-ACP methyl ester carboxylesterase
LNVNNATNHLVVTGATGFIGRHFIYRVLKTMPETRLTLLVRDENAHVAITRVLNLLSLVAKEHGDCFEADRVRERVAILLGDVTKPLCGVAESALLDSRAPNSAEFWHLAASLSFEQSRAAQIDLHNISGSRHAVDLAKALGCTRFVHVSTAYVCGNMLGDVPESLHDLDRSFNNAYERSKCAAEHVIVERCRASSLDCHILRPSVVVGLAGSFAVAGAETGLYGFARELLRMRRAFTGSTQPVRIVADPDAEVNFVPVDVLTDEMLALRTAGFRGTRVHHLTSRRSASAKETLDAVARAIGIPCFDMVSALPKDATPLERLLARRITFYGSYLRSPKKFLRREQSGCVVPGEHVERYLSAYMRERGESRAALSERTLLARDGFPLRTFRNGKPRVQAETVVLVNAFGMPAATLDRLGAVLGAEFNVLTWESRGAPSLEGTLDPHSAGFSRHVEDLHDLLRAHGVDTAHIIGWCTGADVALEFARRSPECVSSLVCLHGGFLGMTPLRRPFQRNLVGIVRAAAHSEARASIYQALMAESMQLGARADADTESRASVQNAMACLDPELSHLTSAPLRSALALHRYGVLLAHYLDEAPSSLPNAPIPALIVTAEDDEISHPDASRVVAQALPLARLRVTTNGGHFAPCKDERLFSDVLSFVLEHSNGAERTPLRMSA